MSTTDRYVTSYARVPNADPIWLADQREYLIVDAGELREILDKIPPEWELGFGIPGVITCVERGVVRGEASRWYVGFIDLATMHFFVADPEAYMDRASSPEVFGRDFYADTIHYETYPFAGNEVIRRDFPTDQGIDLAFVARLPRMGERISATNTE